jgi:hypothetical protein
MQPWALWLELNLCPLNAPLRFQNSAETAKISKFRTVKLEPRQFFPMTTPNVLTLPMLPFN